MDQSKKQFRGHFYSPYFGDRRNDLPCLPRSCGYEYNIKPCVYNVSGAWRGDEVRILWQYTVSGAGILVRDETEIRLDEGKAMIIEFPGDFSYRLASDSKTWEVIFISFHDPFSVSSIRSLINGYGNIHAFHKASPTVCSAWTLYNFMKNNPVPDKYMLSKAGYDFVMNLSSELKTSAGHSSEADIYSKCCAYCMQNLECKITVSELAEHCGYTRSHFSRLFRKSSGESPVSFITSFKLNMAAQILQNENIGIKELSVRCGFDDCGYFCRSFKKFFGLTPSGFRKGDPALESE